MEHNEYLTMEQIEILLKCYYLKRYSRVATDENLTANKVRQIKEKALRIIRLAYSKSYLQGLKFDGEAVLQHMAERNDMKIVDLSKIFDDYIAKGLTSVNKKYWERIKRKNEFFTAAELLDFIYDKYEVDIEGRI